MISNISSGRYISISGNNTPCIDMSRPSAGMLRMNGSTIEVYDGYVWISISNYPTISLTVEAQSLLDWVRTKKEEEEHIDDMCRNNPALAKARDNYEVIKRLVASEKKCDTL